MDRAVAELPEVVEQIQSLAGGIASAPQHPQDLGERLVGRPERSRSRRHLLGQQFRKLPQLD